VISATYFFARWKCGMETSWQINHNHETTYHTIYTVRHEYRLPTCNNDAGTPTIYPLFPVLRIPNPKLVP